jgi:hypothetical protein
MKQAIGFKNYICIDNDHKRESIFLFITCFIIFIIYIHNYQQIGLFTVLDDEYGYWGTAAFLAGYDWSNSVSQIPYYSYGYSLILVPLFWIFDDPMHMYKAAIILNGVFLSISFLISYMISQNIMLGINNYYRIAICAVVAMYPTYIAYSNIAWPEALLIMVCWILAWCFINLTNESKLYIFVLIGFLSVYSYIIHQRALGILVSSIIVLILMKAIQTINWKQLLGSIAPIVVILFAHSFLKDYIQDGLWLNNLGNLANDFSGQFEKISLIFTFDGMTKFFSVLTGQVFYIGAASFLLSFFGLYILFKQTIGTLILAIKTSSIKKINDNKYFYFYAFLLCAFTLSIIISVIFMISPTRIDQFIYGRYTEIVVGPVIILGFSAITNREFKSKKLVMGFVIGFVALALITSYIIFQSGLTTFNPIHAVGIALYRTPLKLALPVALALVGCRLIFLSFSDMTNKIKTMINLIIIATLFLVSGTSVSNAIVTLNMETQKITQVISYMENKTSYPIYFLWSDKNRPDYKTWNNQKVLDRLIADTYQFLLKDKILTLVNQAELKKIPGKKYVIVYESLNDYDVLENYTFCISASRTFLFVSNNESSE